MAEKWHSGITMHRLSFGGGFMGLLFAAGSALVFLLGFPTLWYFVALAAALGVAVALFFKATSNWRSERNKPLSIMTTAHRSPLPARRQAGEHRHLLRNCPSVARA
jgi:hypothetical protein